MPINYNKYPANWKTEIRPTVLKRAGNKCEECGISNHDIGYRDKAGKFHPVHDWYFKESKVTPEGQKLFKVVLTIAHLDHDADNHNVKIERLRAWCQKCHLGYDREHRKKARQTHGL